MTTRKGKHGGLPLRFAHLGVRSPFPTLGAKGPGERGPNMGTWVEIERSWHDTALTNCTLCGRLVPRRMWVVEFDGKPLPFCDAECEELYRSYWLPKYGKAATEGTGARGVQ
jgi:hypothetical protein